MKFILLIGRILFSAIFIEKGVCHFTPLVIKHAAIMGTPLASVLVPVSGALIILGGLSILLGYKARLGAWLLILFLAPVTLIMHRFWEFRDPPLALLHNLCFMKNLALLGACFMVAYFGSGPLSISKK